MGTDVGTIVVIADHRAGRHVPATALTRRRRRVCGGEEGLWESRPPYWSREPCAGLRSDRQGQRRCRGGGDHHGYFESPESPPAVMSSITSAPVSARAKRASGSQPPMRRHGVS
jgi:hypothetical protein